MHINTLATLSSLSILVVASGTVFRLPSPVSMPIRSTLLANEHHKCTGYCNGPTCGDVCSCSRFNFCFKGQSNGPDLYRIYNQPEGEVTVQGKVVGISNTTVDGPQVEWMLKSISGDSYQIVSKLLGLPVAYSAVNSTSPLVISHNKTLPASWAINPVNKNRGLFTIKLPAEDLFWTAPSASSTIELQGGNGDNSQHWRIAPLP